MDVRFKNDNMSCNLQLANMDNTSVVAEGVVKPSSWIKYLEIARDLLTNQIFKRKVLVETNSIRIEFTPQMLEVTEMFDGHHLPRARDLFLRQSFNIDCYVTAVKNQNFTTDFVLKNKGNKVLCTATSENHLKSDLLPHSFNLTSNENIHPKNEVSIVYNFFNTPKINFNTQFPVSLFDLDKQGNMNFGAYIDMCLNCLTESVRVKFLSDFSLANHHILTLNAVIFQSAKFGDNIVIEMWRSFSSFNFVLKCNKMILCNVNIVFFAEGVSPNL